jgi:hypothetical protein
MAQKFSPKTRNYAQTPACSEPPEKRPPPARPSSLRFAAEKWVMRIEPLGSAKAGFAAVALALDKK